MKRILLIITALMCFSAGYAQKASVITGTCGFKDGDSVYLASVGNGGLIPVDSCLVKGGKFTLKETVNVASLRAILIIENKMPVAATEIITEPGVNLSVNFKTNSIEIPNSKSNAVWTNLGNYEQEQTKKIEQLWSVLSDSTKTIDVRLRAKQMIDSITASTYSEYAKVIYDNIPSNISGFLLWQHHSNLSEEDLNKIMEQMKKKSPEDAYYKTLAQRFKIEEETAVGKDFKEIALVDISGNMKRLSTVVKANKLVLVDFWASWCRPCIAEMPNVKRIYAAYHDKGLEIYGVSLDENQLNWQTAVQRLGLNWIHVSDLRGWQSKAAQTYNIQGIPATLLIDSSGKIVAKNLRGEDLEKKIAEILK
ncbi:MAG: AhpC/TSA family protein [Bacteroidales bacterium]|nr:AhpC/TSA family protein [Bacteroidales bacterium]